MKRIVGYIAALLLGSVAQAQTPAFDPRSWKGAIAGPPTQVMVLGSPHLSEFVGLDRALLTPLLDRLAAFKPDIITHEGISGEQCDMLQRYAATYPGAFDSYCWDTVAAEKATGLTVPAARSEVEKMLAGLPATPDAAQRRRLAALFLAANDRPSARVQWARLPAAERHAGDGIDAALLAILTPKPDARANESIDVGVALAVRLGLERIYAIDDHTSDNIQALAGPGFEAAIRRIWSSPKPPGAAEYERRKAALKTGDDMLAFYRFINLPGTQTAFINADFGAALQQQTPELYGRQYVAWYEVRNLRMVANIRTAFANHPGARVLNIVGASHKAYFDAYLDMMHEVKLVDAESVLK